MWKKWITLLSILTLSTVVAFAQTNSDAQSEKAAASMVGNDLVVEDMPRVIEKMKADVPSTREHVLGLTSEAYTENPGNPALRLERLWVNEQGSLLELVGLPRKGNKYSAIMDISSLYIYDLNSRLKSDLVFHVGGQLIIESGGKRMVNVAPGEKIYLFFGPVNDLNPQSLRYIGWAGGEDRYFDKIDPLFSQRYEKSYQSAIGGNATVEDMKKFLLEFASNDPEKRAQRVFADLIQRLRAQQTFDGYLQAYKLVKDPADERLAGKLALSQEQREQLAAAVAKVKAAEAAKREELNRALQERQAEQRRRDEARQMEARKQEEIQQEQRRQVFAADAEARCMRTPSCRRSWEAEQAKCVGQIRSCRSGCDRLTGADGSHSGFFANLTASMLARGCYSGCKCGSGFVDLLGKAGVVLSEGVSSSSASNAKRTAQSDSSDGSRSRSTSSSQGPETTERLRTYWDGDTQHIFVRCAGSGKEKNYTFNRRSGRYCTPGFSPSCESEDWVQRAICK